MTRHRFSAHRPLMLAALFLTGCDSRPEPAQPTSQPVVVTSAPVVEIPDPILPESKAWTLDEALPQLADPDDALSAAVRLVRLSETVPLCVPDPLPAQLANRLRVLSLGDSHFAIGLNAADEKTLRAVALIDSDGQVTLPVSGIEEELSRLHVSSDADVFPHLLITPLRVLFVSAELSTALVLREPLPARFALGKQDGYSYVALVLAADATVEVAKYTWDPFEAAFMGPVADLLPDPPGGRFALDLQASIALIPVGGEIEAPEKDPLPPLKPLKPVPRIE